MYRSNWKVMFHKCGYKNKLIASYSAQSGKVPRISYSPLFGSLSLTNCYGILLRAVQPQHLQPQNLQLFVVLHIPYRLVKDIYRESSRLSSPTYYLA